MSSTIIRFGSTLALLLLMLQVVCKVEGASLATQLDSAGKRIVQDLDCYRMKLVIKSLTLRIHRLEMETFGVEKTPFELAEIDSWCPTPVNELSKRNFDEIDRSGFRGFSKKNFDEIDKSGFRGFTG